MHHYNSSIPACLIIMIMTFGNLSAQNLKVFIMAGQSNMQGHGEVGPEDINGTLENFVANNTSGNFGYIQNEDGSWATPEDVWVRYDHEQDGVLAGVLNVGYGGYEGQIGPELGFGHLLGQHCDDQVLLIKTCWGGKNLAVDFRPPSSGGMVGPYYTQMMADVAIAIENIGTEFPEYSGGNIEIAGFCWFQGWNDGEEEAYLNEYEQNLKNLINDVRNELNAPNLPVVVGVTGNGGYELQNDDLWVLQLQTILVPAQISAVASPELENVAIAETRDFWFAGDLSPEPGFVHHWNNNAESYLRIGNAMGQEMITLLDQISSSDEPGNEQHLVKVFPSPASNFITISGIEVSDRVDIYEINGRLRKSFKSLKTGGLLDVSELPPNVYIIRVSDKNGSTIITQKMIKQ